MRIVYEPETDGTNLIDFAIRQHIPKGEAFGMAGGGNTRFRAYEFSVVLWRDIGAKDMHKVIKRNGTKAYSDGCCATHDFIDANMAMAEAFEVHKIHDIAGFDGDCPEHDLAIDLWNGAWDKARKDKFAL